MGEGDGEGGVGGKVESGVTFAPVFYYGDVDRGGGAGAVDCWGGGGHGGGGGSEQGGRGFSAAGAWMSRRSMIRDSYLISGIREKNNA